MIVEEAKRILLVVRCVAVSDVIGPIRIRARRYMAINRIEEHLGLHLPMFLRFLNLPKYADLD